MNFSNQQRLPMRSSCAFRGTMPILRLILCGFAIHGTYLRSVGFAQVAFVSEESQDQAELVGPRALSRAFRNAARQATPAVVTILSYGQQDAFGGQNQSDSGGESGEDNRQSNDKELTGIGSGVIVSPDGRVITNNHVIAGAKRVVVQLADETEIEAIEVRGDADSDVATLQIKREEPFSNAGIADSDLLEIGDWVLAIGSPFRLEATVSAGIISAKNRTLQRINRGRLIQTDAAINPGNSGGPLIDLDGKVVAISTAIATRNGGYQGIGFAIPINQAYWIANELAIHGVVRRAAIGVRMAELNPKIASRFNLTAGLGVLAYQVIENSAAERAGIQPLDVIMEFAGERVRDPGALQEVIERLPVGSTQSAKIYRNGEEIMIDVTLASLEDPTLQDDQSDEENAEGDKSNKESSNEE
jgi:serine protease Do